MLKPARSLSVLKRKTRFKLASQVGQSNSKAILRSLGNEGFGVIRICASTRLNNGGTSNSELQVGHRYMAELYYWREDRGIQRQYSGMIRDHHRTEFEAILIQSLLFVWWSATDIRPGSKFDGKLLASINLMDRSDALLEIASVIAEIPLLHPIRVAIDGRDGAGKTTLADELVRPVRSLGREVIRASVDGFHNPREIRYEKGSASSEGFFRDSYNYDALRDLLIDPLGPSGSLNYRTTAFDWRTDSPSFSPLKHASENAIVLFDGIFLLRPELIDLWDFKIFTDVTVEIGMARCAARDGSSPDPMAKANRRYVEGQKLYFAECNPKSAAHVIVDNNDTERPFLTWNSALRLRGT